MFSAAQLIHNCNTRDMSLWVRKPGFCIVFLGVLDAKWYQPWAVGDSLHLVQLCPFTASSHSASHIPDLPMLSPAAFYFAFWTQHDVLHSIRQGCLRETMFSGQICVMSDTAVGREDLNPGRHHRVLLPCCTVESVHQQSKELSGLRPDQGQFWAFQQHRVSSFAVM